MAVYLLATAGDSQAQVQACGPNDVVPWWPRRMFTAGGDTLTGADRKAVEARLGAVEALMRKTPYATPRGFAVAPAFAYHQITDRTTLYPYEFFLGVFLLCSKYDEHGADIVFSFNPDPRAWSMANQFTDERGDTLYVERPRREPLFGSIATFGGFHEENSNTAAFYLLFTAGGESPTLPVSREEYLRYKIFEHEGKDQGKLKAMTADLSRTPYERWVDEAPERKKRNEELFALIARSNAAQAAKTRAEMEKLEQAEGEKLKRADAFERERQAKALAAMKAIGDNYRAQLAAMTPRERSSPALIGGFDDLVAAGTPNAAAIVRRNAAFYRVRSSPVEPRALLVHMPGSHKVLRPQQAQLYKQMDWAAIKKMVNP
jgi:hypothetical protein